MDILTVSKLGAFLFLNRADGDFNKLQKNGAPVQAP